MTGPHQRIDWHSAECDYALCSGHSLGGIVGWQCRAWAVCCQYVLWHVWVDSAWAAATLTRLWCCMYCTRLNWWPPHGACCGGCYVALVTVCRCEGTTACTHYSMHVQHACTNSMHSTPQCARAQLARGRLWRPAPLCNL